MQNLEPLTGCVLDPGAFIRQGKGYKQDQLSDKAIDRYYPEAIRSLSYRHWTPVMVAEQASRFLAAERGARVLDIGSGVGKFCLVAAMVNPDAYFYGVEQRSKLVDLSESVRSQFGLENVKFLNYNFTQVNFKEFDHFYFFNSFYENLTGTQKIDDSIDYSSELYNYYNRYLYKQLEQKPPGTRIATYHSLEDEIPPSYHVVGGALNNLLKFWIKI